MAAGGAGAHDSSSHFADEVRQSVREKLLLARDGAPPRIGQYSGRWPLTTWLRTIAVRAAVDLRRSGGAAFATFDDEQANLLRLQIVDGLRTSQIAALFRVDRSTIKRRLAACRDQVLAQTSSRLREKPQLSPEEFVSIAGLVQSQLHLSLTRLLQRS